MIVGIHQPAYLPWLGYFDRISKVDLFIYLDTVQFQKGSFQNRNRILSRNGPVWLTVPVETSGKLYSTTLKDLKIDQTQRWQAKHRSTLRMNYSGALMVDEIFARVERFYLEPWHSLSDLCWEMLLEFNKILSLDTKIIRASEMPPVEGKKSDLVLNLCKEVGATKYLSGSQGAEYLDMDNFSAAMIDVEFHNYIPAPYLQQSAEFVPALGVIDYLFNTPNPEEMFACLG